MFQAYLEFYILLIIANTIYDICIIYYSLFIVFVKMAQI